MVISNDSLEQKDFTGISFKNQTVAWSTGLRYFRAGIIKRDEMGDMKTFQFREGVKLVAGLDAVLDTIGNFYIYARAVIDEKVGMIVI